MNESFESISPTAIITSYPRVFTDIPYEKEIPSLTDALIQMFKSAKLNDQKCDELTKDILDKCKNHIDPKYEEINNKYNNITKENAYIICAYTCESKEKKYLGDLC